MKKIFQDLSSGNTLILDAPVPNISENSLKILSKVSLISSGTERSLVEFGKGSYIDKARQQPEKVKQVLDKLKTDGISATYDSVKSKLQEPLPLGYSNVGIIEEMSSDIEGFKLGDRVVSNGPHSDVVVVSKNLCARIPQNVDDESAAFTVVGSIALQSIRLAQPTLGESFVVMGAGLIGLLTIQLLKANGCRVLAVDLDKERLSLAKKFGAEICNPSSGDDLISQSKEFSREKGVDGVIIAASSNSNDLISQSAKISRKRGRIILIGVVGLHLDRSEFYNKEINFQVSCSYGPGRYDTNYEEEGNDYPIGYVRWTEQRNFEAFLDMLASGKVDVRPLITSRYKFLEAATAYEELFSNTSTLGILLEYDSSFEERLKKNKKLKKENLFSNKDSVVGFIGAGNYASRVLIPLLKQTGAYLHTLVSANGINSSLHGVKAGFANASSDVKSILNEDKINTVFIATRHNTHATLVSSMLEKDKNVWVEKPLTIDLESLTALEEFYKKKHLEGMSTPQLMVGFNRRFSPHIKKIKELLSNTKEPKTIIATINAGYISKDHWTQNPEIGGGRIIGECCHFIDLMRFIVGSQIVSVEGRALISNSGSIITDNSSVTLGFKDGSFGSINYLSNGAASFPKERIEVFVSGKVLQLDNFKKMKGFGWKGFNKMNLWSQDKGQKSALGAFIKSIETCESCIPLEEIFEVARVSIEAENILRNQKSNLIHK